jgi:hypothetical protein
VLHDVTFMVRANVYLMKFHITVSDSD